MPTTTRVPWVYQLYPILLALCAIVGFGTCQWFHLHDVSPQPNSASQSVHHTISHKPANFASLSLYIPFQLPTREPVDDMSLKYMFTAVPQLFAGLLLLYYARTFRRPSSAFQHELIVESCVHQTTLMLLQGSILHSTAQLSLSLCCAFPSLCPVHTDTCELSSIIECPKRVKHLPNYDLLPRLAQCLATYALVFALSSLNAAHCMKALDTRRRRAKFVTFKRRSAAARPASASVQI